VASSGCPRDGEIAGPRLDLADSEKYSHNGGMTLAHHYGAASREGAPARGSAIGIVAPFRGPLEAAANHLTLRP